MQFGFHRYVGLGPQLYRDRDILDLGSGDGGRTVRFTELGARSVVGVEVREAMVELGSRFAGGEARPPRSGSAPGRSSRSRPTASTSC